MDDSSSRPLLPRQIGLVCQRQGLPPSHHLLTVHVAAQRMWLWEEAGENVTGFPDYCPRREYVISTSRNGIGQRKDSNCTPLGLHRIAEKIGAGCPLGTVFRSRKVAGYTWEPGLAAAPITHRILWLEGLEPGFNQGGNVDSHERYIYIHGTGDESTLGQPASQGCVHVAGQELLPLFELVPSGTLVWIGAQ